MMRQNLGKRDRFLWVVIGIILIVVAIYKLEWYVWQFLATFAGVLLLISGITGFSMIYSVLGYSSKGYGIDRITKRDIERAVKEYGLKTDAIKVIPPKKIVAKKVEVKKVVKKTVVKKIVAKKVVPKKTVVKKVVVKKAVKKVTKKSN